MSKYPIYLELEGKKAVIIGAGSVAARKAKTLVATGAKVKVVARTIEPVFRKLCEGLPIEITEGDYFIEYLENAFLVIAATNDNDLNTKVFEDCQRLQLLCNVVDVPHLCNFYVPAIIKRGDLQIAISTNGKCPAYAGHLRRKLQALISDDQGRFLDALDWARHSVIETVLPQKRKELLSKLAGDDSYQVFLDTGVKDWKLMAEKIISDYQS